MTFAIVALLSAASAQEGGLPLDTARADFTCVSDQSRVEPLVGVPPMSVTCEVQLSELFTYDEASWYFGDGSSAEGDVVDHTYEIEGQFGISLELVGLRYAVEDTGPAAAVDPELTKYGIVTACGVPFSEFFVEKRAGLTYELFNRSDFLPGCVDEVQWTVVRGTRRDDEVVFQEVAWEPVVELPDSDTYTFFLDLYGPAGGAGAKLSVDAVYGVDERLQGNRRWGCDASGGAGGAFLGSLGLLALLRRRSLRRS